MGEASSQSDCDGENSSPRKKKGRPKKSENTDGERTLVSNN